MSASRNGITMAKKEKNEGNSGFDDTTSYPHMTLWYRFILGFGKIFVLPFIYHKFNVHAEKFGKKIKDPSLIAFNHGSDYDQFMVIKGVPEYKRYVASDALIRTKKMRIAFALVDDFILRRKGERADNVVNSAVASIEKGIHVAMAPEGGETINGCTNHVRPKTGKMVKQMNCGLVTYRLTGMYFKKPPWASTSAKKAPMFGEPIGMYSREEVQAMTEEEINELIYRDLYVNHYDWQKEHMIPYDRPNRAEFQEYVVYTCPKCKEIGHIHTKENDIYCDNCGYRATVNIYGLYEGEDLAFDNLYDWDIWQKENLRDRMEEWKKEPDTAFFHDGPGTLAYLEDNTPVPIAENISLEMAVNYLRFFGDDFELRIPMEEVRAITVAKRRHVAIITGDKYYQFNTVIPTSPQKYKTAKYILEGKSHLSF